MAHQFVITKGGWKCFGDFLQPYHLSTAVSRCVDPEDFFNGMFRKRVVCKAKPHQFQFPEDLIRNEFDLDEQELRKEKWIAYKKALDLVHQLDISYDPLSSFYPFAEKMKFLILSFEEVMQTLKEKREVVIKNNPEKETLILNRFASARPIPPGNYMLHKKSNYSVLMSALGEPYASKGKRKIHDVIDIPSSPKKQRVGKEIQLEEPVYSPSQSPIHIGDEQAAAEKLLQLGNLGEITYTYDEVEEGMLEEPLAAKMNITTSEFKGQEWDPEIKRANEDFLADDKFITSEAFMQFVWKQSIDKYNSRCKKRKGEQPHKDPAIVEEEIKQEMVEEFKTITPQQGRDMVAKARVLILPEWDIADALVLEAVRKETKPMEGVTFNKDNATLVMWSLKRDENKKKKDTSMSSYLGGMMVKRVQTTGVVGAASTVLETAKFSVAVAEREAKEKADLQVKLETILKA